MVVQEDTEPETTTTTALLMETPTAPLKLDYETEEIQELSVIPELTSELENFDEVESVEIKEPKVVEIPFLSGIETGIEIMYTSLKLKHFPIKESNLSLHEEFIENIGLHSSTLRIGKNLFNNVNIRFLGYDKFKLIEFKTREFKFAISVALFDNNIVKRYGDYFKYEIFSKLKNSRIKAISEIFKDIFSGAEISFKINDLQGNIIFENPIQAHKFSMVIETLEKYEKIGSLLNLNKFKYFSDTSLDFYTIHLLYNYLLGNKKISSWINFRINNDFNINSGDTIIFSKIHKLDFRGFNYDLREKVIIKSQISEGEIDNDKNVVYGYKKIVDITLEKVEK